MESPISKRSGAVTSRCRQGVCCMVDGCNSDLSKCREYHRRHKVCQLHSKTPKVMIRGEEQRFCQQCSRFHYLVEFDNAKRSCRKRLDGHNRRRRKPQPHTSKTSNSYQGISPEAFPSRGVMSSCDHQTVSSFSFGAGASSGFFQSSPIQFPLLQESGQASSSVNSSSDRALSLLSESSCSQKLTPPLPTPLRLSDATTAGMMFPKTRYDDDSSGTGSRPYTTSVSWE